MKMAYRVAVALVAGACIGGAIIEALHAQAKAPAYVVVAIRKINDADGFKSGVVEKTSPDTLKAAGGHYVVRTQNITSLDGLPPQRFILIEFDSAEKAKAWNSSERQKAVNDARMKTTDSLSFIVEGMAN
jgi:uncharacterized protein (DUF1330 family)